MQNIQNTQMKFAYADPPYLNQSRRHYSDHPEHAIYDTLRGHEMLIDRLVTEFPEGWALSCSTPSLRYLLPFCPSDIRIAAWVKSFGAFKKGVRPAYMWEPVIFRGGRNKGHPPPVKGGVQTTPKDFCITEYDNEVIVEPITLKKGLTGAKPIRFCVWVLDLLNVRKGDTVIDLFPGTGVMGHVALEITGPSKVF